MRVRGKSNDCTEDIVMPPGNSIETCYRYITVGNVKTVFLHSLMLLFSIEEE